MTFLGLSLALWPLADTLFTHKPQSQTPNGDVLMVHQKGTVFKEV
jgi:hypothetical protein